MAGGGAITLLLPASARGREGDFSLELVGHGSLAASVIVDDLEVVINAPQFGADFNTDSIVDGQDFLLWQRGFGKPVPTASKIDGDADGDQDVDSADLSFWQQQYGGLTVNAVALASAQLAAVGDAAADIDQPSQNQFIDLLAHRPSCFR